MTTPTQPQAQPASSYRQQTLDLAATAGAAVLAVLARRMSDDLVPPVGAAAVARVAARAVTAADLALALAVTQRGEVALALGLVLPDDVQPRAEAGLATLLATLGAAERDPDRAAKRRVTIGPRAVRLARGEVLDIGRRAFRDGMVARRVPGWTRATGPDPCPLCRSLADGTVLPPDQLMASHPGCSCFPLPTPRSPTKG